MTERRTVHQRGILDTSALIPFNRYQEAGLLPAVSVITTITLAELSVGPLTAKNEIERARRLAHLQQAEASFNPLPFDVDAARAFGGVAASLRQAGRKVESRRKDAMIAAIALANDLPVYTCNARDFEGIDDLEVISVPVPA
jgi:predicted nucleic acid-binding protein